MWLLARKWFWQLVGFGAVIATLYFAWHHYEYLRSQAALVPALQKTIGDQNKQATDLAARLRTVTEARARADEDLTKAEADLQAVQTYLVEKSAHAPAQVNPVCRPSDADRKLRNDTNRALLGLGSDQGTTGLPQAAGTPH